MGSRPMPLLTRRLPGETTRKPGERWPALPATRLARLRSVAKRLGSNPLHLLGILAFVFAGCATRGPNHVYLTAAGGDSVHDLGPTRASIGGLLKPGETAVGLAYDFNTDHLFVRIAPAQVIRVIERPSGKILREMPLPSELHATGPADLAIRSRDRHLFAAHPDGRSVVELSLFGKFIRRFEPAGLDSPLGGLAYDQKQDRLLVLAKDRVGAVGPDGHVTHYVTLSAPTDPVSLGFDSEAHHFFVPLADGFSLGEFDADGRLVATHAADGPITAVDAGPRSFVRVF